MTSSLTARWRSRRYCCIFVWNTATRKITVTFALPDRYGVTSVAFGPDATLAVAFADGQIYLWHLSP